MMRNMFTASALSVAMATSAGAQSAQQPTMADVCLQSVFDVAQRNADLMAENYLNMVENQALLGPQVEVEFYYSEEDINKFVSQCEKDFDVKITDFSAQYTAGDGYSITGIATNTINM